MIDQQSKANAFCSLHEQDKPFLIPNPWDAGSAKLLTNLGFEALATTSLGVSVSDGSLDTSAKRVLDNLKAICAATDLPVNADLENCFADEPAAAASMFPRAYEAGAVGASIEDATGRRENPIYEFNQAVERVHAAIEITKTLPQPFTLTARAEGLLYDIGALEEIIKRLHAFEELGADVLYAPGLRTIEEMKVVMNAVCKPVNIVMGFADPDITLAQLAEIGVRRISIGGGLSRVALNAMMVAAREMKAGKFSFVRDMISTKEMGDAFRS